MRVLVFGDSITQGFWDTDGGWVGRIRKYYDQKAIETDNYEQPTIFNLGVSGDSSDDLVKRVKAETEARNREGLAFVISIGVNDSRTKAGAHYSSPERYLENLHKIYEITSEYSDKIIFVGLTPCVEERSNPVSWGDTGYTNDRIKEFDDVLKNFCTEKNINLVDVLSKFTEALNDSELLPDSLHPNEEGHQLIADLVLPVLNKLLG